MHANEFYRIVKAARRSGSTRVGDHLLPDWARDVPVFESGEILEAGAWAFAFEGGVYLDSRIERASLAGVVRHELGHVAQQRAGRVWSKTGLSIEENAALEAEADGLRGELPGWAYVHPVSGTGVIQCLKKLLMSSGEVAAFDKFRASAVEAGVKEGQVDKALENAPNWAAFKTLVDAFTDPPLGFDPVKQVSSFVAKYNAPAPTAAPVGAKPGVTAPKPGVTAPKPGVTPPKPATTTAGGSAPKTTAWGTPAVGTAKPPAPVVVPKLGAKSADDDPGALKASHAVQDWDGLKAVLQTTAKPSTVTSVKANKMLSTSGETREAEMLIKLSDGSDYKFVLHFHPDPKNGNFLHFKNSQSASANHKVKWDHWAIKAAGIKEEKFKAGKLT